MNTVIVYGKILNIDYKIVDKGKVYAVALIKFKIDNEKEFVNIIAKNDIADQVFRNRKVGEKVWLKVNSWGGKL